MSVAYATKLAYIKGLIKHEIDAYQDNYDRAKKDLNSSSERYCCYFEGGRDSLKWILKKLEEK
jgi:hypothetical protein